MPEIQAAFNAAPQGGVVAEKDVKEAYRWLSAREIGCWSDGFDMRPTWSQHYLDIRSPVTWAATSKVMTRVWS